MKSIISSTYDDNYLFFLPIVTWCWNKLGVDVICFMPKPKETTTCIVDDDLEISVDSTSTRFVLAQATCIQNGFKIKLPRFNSPPHKEATYAQCSRLYGACLDLPEDEILITSDVDMAVFKIPPMLSNGCINVFGHDLVPPYQFPMCYASGAVKYWRKSFELNGCTYQQELDKLLGHIEAEHFRGNYWGKDQETLFNKTKDDVFIINRARPGTQFASNRIDRDDAYFMDRLSPDIVDYHMHRPGFTDDNFEKILAVIKYFYPNDDLTWMKEYQQQYKALL